MSKDKNKKSRCPKNYQLTAAEVARIAGCSISSVKQIRVGTYIAMESSLAKRVLAIDKIAIQGKSLLIQEIERVVQF